jgi:hypothetical protein
MMRQLLLFAAFLMNWAGKRASRVRPPLKAKETEASADERWATLFALYPAVRDA